MDTVFSRRFSLQATLVALTLGCSTLAWAEPPVSINGYSLSPAEVRNLELQLGMRVIPGAYLVDARNGCWVNVNTGMSGCPTAGAGTYVGSGGSGEWNGNGDWSYTSDVGGASVGGTGDGCVYASNWSNC